MAVLNFTSGVVKGVPGTIYDSVTGLQGSNLAFPAGCQVIGRTDQSQPYPILRLASPAATGYFAKFVSKNSKFAGFRLEGAGLFAEGDGCEGLVVDDCEFAHNHTAGPKPNALECSSVMRNVKITRNLFTGNRFGIFTAAGYDNCLIANNHFDQTEAGLHLDARNTNMRGLLIEQNLLRGMIGMGIELQGTADGVIVQDNWYDEPRYIFNTNKMAYSLILDGSKNILTQRNVHISKTVADSPNNAYVRDIFEAGGDNHRLLDNYSDGGNCILAGNDGVGTCSLFVIGNRFKNYKEPPRISFPAPGRTLFIDKTSPTQQLSQTMEDRITNKKLPNRWTRYGAVVTPPVEPPPVDPCLSVKAELKACQDAGVMLQSHLNAANTRLSNIRQAGGW